MRNTILTPVLLSLITCAGCRHMFCTTTLEASNKELVGVPYYLPVTVLQITVERTVPKKQEDAPEITVTFEAVRVPDTTRAYVLTPTRHSGFDDHMVITTDRNGLLMTVNGSSEDKGVAAAGSLVGAAAKMATLFVMPPLGAAPTAPQVADVYSKIQDALRRITPGKHTFTSPQLVDIAGATSAERFPIPGTDGLVVVYGSTPAAVDQAKTLQPRGPVFQDEQSCNSVLTSTAQAVKMTVVLALSVRRLKEIRDEARADKEKATKEAAALKEERAKADVSSIEDEARIRALDSLIALWERTAAVQAQRAADADAFLGALAYAFSGEGDVVNLMTVSKVVGAPEYGRIIRVPINRTYLVKNEVKLGLSEGVLTSLDVVWPSPIAGVLAAPGNLIGKALEGILGAFDFGEKSVTAEKKALEAEKAVMELREEVRALRGDVTSEK